MIRNPVSNPQIYLGIPENIGTMPRTYLSFLKRVTECGFHAEDCEFLIPL